GWLKWLAFMSATALACVAAGSYVVSGQLEEVHGVILSAPIVLGAAAVLNVRRSEHLLVGLVGLGFCLAQVVFVSAELPGLEWGARLLLPLFPLAAIVVATTELPSGASARLALTLKFRRGKD